MTRKHSLLLTSKSFESSDGSQPTVLSIWMTVGTLVAGLVAIEQAVRFLLLSYQHTHPILENETNRLILARHIGIDTLCCVVVAMIGLKNINVYKNVLPGLSSEKKPMTVAGFETRLFTPIPAGQHIALMFFAYQVKNMYDTVAWNDGIVFIIHHICAGLTAYGAAYQGVGNFYSFFFLGLSEISTGVLCVLANFDDVHGVPGLGDAFPTAKIIIAVLFVILFLLCRTIIWPLFGYYFLRDAHAAYKSGVDYGFGRKLYIRFLVINFIVLTVLQIIWLGEIIVMAKQEIMKFV